MTDLRKCIIVDDEPAAHYVLLNHLAKVKEIEVVGQLYNAIEATAYLAENEVDLMFLDINMPEMTGLQLLKTLANPPKTILCTAYSKYALESYEYGVIDYLHKPIYFPRFLTAIDRYLSLPYSKPIVPKPEISTISFRVDGEPIEVRFDDILYIQSFGNYVRIYTDLNNYFASFTTHEIEQLLPEEKFLRIHKSYIVALEKITLYNRSSVIVGNHDLPVGITYRQKLAGKITGS
jgi:DNA-binding LytR/AlgR family response regulator